MRFLTVFKAVETGAPPPPEEIAAMGRLIEDSVREGVLLTTEGCLPAVKGARVRLANGKITVVDGPFSESKEVIGGFAILNVASKAAAIEQVRRFLAVAGDGEAEIRELYETPACAPEPAAGR